MIQNTQNKTDDIMNFYIANETKKDESILYVSAMVFVFSSFFYKSVTGFVSKAVITSNIMFLLCVFFVLAIYFFNSRHLLCFGKESKTKLIYMEILRWVDRVNVFCFLSAIISLIVANIALLAG